MRWTNPKEGDIRIKKQFAFFPVRVKEEWRWLENVTIEQKYCWGLYGHSWFNTEFIDNDTIQNDSSK